MRASTLWTVNAGLQVTHAIGAVAAWSALPPKLPLHFNFSGTPDAWARTSVLSWFGPLAISLALSWFIRALTTRGPLEFWDIPEKQRFLKLSPEQRAPVMEMLHALVAATAVATSLVFAALQVGIYQTARGATRTLPWYVDAVMLGSLAALLLATIPWTRAVRRAILEASGEP